MSRQRTVAWTVLPGMLVLGALGLRVHGGFVVGMLGWVTAGLLAAWNIRCPRCGYPVFRVLPRQPISLRVAALPARCPQCDLPSGSSWPLS